MVKVHSSDMDNESNSFKAACSEQGNEVKVRGEATRRD